MSGRSRGSPWRAQPSCNPSHGPMSLIRGPDPARGRAPNRARAFVEGRPRPAAEAAELGPLAHRSPGRVRDEGRVRAQWGALRRPRTGRMTQPGFSSVGETITRLRGVENDRVIASYRRNFPRTIGSTPRRSFDSLTSRNSRQISSVCKPPGHQARSHWIRPSSSACHHRVGCERLARDISDNLRTSCASVGRVPSVGSRTRADPCRRSRSDQDLRCICGKMKK